MRSVMVSVFALLCLAPAWASAQGAGSPQPKPAVDVTKVMLDAAAKIGAAARRTVEQLYSPEALDARTAFYLRGAAR